MSKELVVSSNRHETKVAVIEDDQVVEVYFQRGDEYSLAGSIHKGRVTRVLPGMQSAFVDIGLDRDAFLYVSDFFEDNEEYDKIVTSVEEKVLRLEKGPPVPVVPAIVEAPAVVAGVPEPEPAPAEAPPPAASNETASAQDDRRGRRSRRRRQRGRGFPESKYAAPAAETPVVPSGEYAATLAEDEPEEFPVLPGESLAKYSHSDDPGEEDNGAAESTDEPVGDTELVEPEPMAEVHQEPGAGESEAPDSPGATAWTEPDPEDEEPEPSEQPEKPEMPAPPEDAPEEPAPGEPEPEVGNVPQVEEPESPAPWPVTETRSDESEPRDQEQPGRLCGNPETRKKAFTVGEDDDGEISAGEDEDTPEADGEGSADTGETETDDQGPEPARMPTSLTATLREQGGRFLHRTSRRTRRKMRGGPEREEGRPPYRGGERPERAEPKPEQRAAARPETKTAQPSISDLLREGQEIIVQVAKEPLGQKGARITSHIALPGRYLVYMPTVDHIGVSRKIATDEERLRLKRVLQSNRAGIPGGYIVRTAGEGKAEEELRNDMLFLYNLWLDLRQKAEKRPAPALIHHDLSVVERVLRDQVTSTFKNIWSDSEDVYESVLRFVQRFQPVMVGRVKLYTRPQPIFDAFNITQELEKALRPKVWLKSGGYIVINQTEALVAVDVNTGKYVGRSNRLEDTIVKTNTDAIKEIVRQIRLRDLGGIIVVDFIDMDERKNRQKVMQVLEEAMRSDRAPYKILQFNDFGLVAITRKRVKQSLERTLCSPCPYCEGSGYVKSPQTVVGEILQEAQKLAAVLEGPDVMLRVNPEVAKLLKSTDNDYLQEVEEVLKRNVIIKSDSQLHQDKFDLA